MSPRGSTRRPVSPMSVPTHGAMAGDARPNEFETTSAQKRFFRRNTLCGIACQNERAALHACALMNDSRRASSPGKADSSAFSTAAAAASRWRETSRWTRRIGRPLSSRPASSTGTASGPTSMSPPCASRTSSTKAFHASANAVPSREPEAQSAAKRPGSVSDASPRISASAGMKPGSSSRRPSMSGRTAQAAPQNKIAFNRDSRVFAVFSAPLRPSPDPHTPP